VNSFVVEFRSKGVNEKRVFGYFEELMKGVEIAPLNCDVGGILDTASLLGNTELFSKVVDSEGPLEKKNVCSRLQRKCDASLRDECEVDFAAQHFYELDLESLQQLDLSIVERIVSSPVLCLDREDSLLDFILRFDSDAILLVGYLHTI
jgi:hypothetical protein